jgi:DNA-directed RNA polymerase specialized sigma24 family protein
MGYGYRARHQGPEGDQAAFAEIASASYGRLHSLAYGILRDRALAEDAVQQAMLDAWRNLPKLRDPARFEAWAYRLAVHACYAEAKRAFSRQKLEHRAALLRLRFRPSQRELRDPPPGSRRGPQWHDASGR